MDWPIIAALVSILLIHWIADFLCQTDDMALNKSKSWFYLFLHCIVYSSITTAGIVSITGHFLSPCCWFGVLAILFLSHMAIDACTSRLASHFYRNERRAAFFNTIGFDQFLHVSIIIILVFLAKYKAAT